MESNTQQDNNLQDVQPQKDLMTRRFQNGRLFHLWVIGITPLNSVKKLDEGKDSVQ